MSSVAAADQQGTAQNMLLHLGRKPAAEVKQEQDDELEQRVRLFMATSNLPGLRHIAVKVDGSTVILSGQVNTFYEKQLAAKFSRRVAGVIHVLDDLEVRSYAPKVEIGHMEQRRAHGFDPARLR